MPRKDYEPEPTLPKINAICSFVFEGYLNTMKPVGIHRGSGNSPPLQAVNTSGPLDCITSCYLTISNPGNCTNQNLQT